MAYTFSNSKKYNKVKGNVVIVVLLRFVKRELGFLRISQLNFFETLFKKLNLGRNYIHSKKQPYYFRSILMEVGSICK